MRRLAMVLVPLAILVAALLGAGGLWATKPEIKAKAVEERRWTVAAVAARRVDVRPTIAAFGQIVAGRESALRPLVAGRIVAVGDNFVAGGMVKKGDLLIAIDPFEMRADQGEAEARIAETQAQIAELGAEMTAASELLDTDREQVAIAKRDLSRRVRLRGTAAGSEKTVDDARMALSLRRQQMISRQETIDRLAARVEQFQAVVRRWRVVLDRAHRALADRRLTAPFDGFLVDIAAEIGSRVGVGDRVARLIDARRLEVRFHLSDAAFARLLAGGDYRGRAVAVEWRVGARRFAFKARIGRLQGEIDATSGGVDLYARIDGLGLDTVLRPGAFVAVRIPDRLYKNVIALPETALHEGGTVYTVADERLVPRPVEVVVRDRDRVLVRADLAPETVIVTTRFPEIGPGVKVVVR